MPAGVAGFQVFNRPEGGGREAHEGDGVVIPAPPEKDCGLEFKLSVDDDGYDVTHVEIGVLGDECAAAEADVGDDRRRTVGQCGKTNWISPVLAPIFPRGAAETIFNRHRQVLVERYLMPRLRCSPVPGKRGRCPIVYV